jgi:ATPase family AAA domain-containing protein 3A/B
VGARVQERAIKVAAAATVGFSGREIAKLMASVQAAAYGTADATLTQELFDMVLQLKTKQHTLRQRLGGDSVGHAGAHSTARTPVPASSPR